jgi:hypothetical protein
MSTEPHIADADEKFFIMSVTPDMCKVGRKVVAFDSSQELPSELMNYSKKTIARDHKIVLIGSAVKGLKGNAGKGLKSGVAVALGNSKILEGSPTVFIEDKAAVRDGDEVDMNGKVS